jgi:hypothetical protein
MSNSLPIFLFHADASIFAKSSFLWFAGARETVGLTILVVVALGVVGLRWSSGRRKSARKRPIHTVVFYLGVMCVSIVIVGALLWLGDVACVIFWPHKDYSKEEALMDARGRLAKAGAENVRREAREIYKRFEHSDKQTSTDLPVQEYMAMESLGHVAWMQSAESSTPSYIAIRVGSHSHSYLIAVCNPDDPRKPEPSSHITEIDPSIYVFKY